MKLSAFWTIGALVFFAILERTAVAAEAMDGLNLSTTVGYQSVEFENDIEGNGVSVGVEGAIALARLRAASLMVGLEFEGGTMKGELGTTAVSTNVTSFGGFAGFNLPAAQSINIETLLHYDSGIAGKARLTSELGVMTRDINSFQRLTAELRCLFDISSTKTVGIGFRSYRGDMTLEDIPSDLDFNGYSVNATFLIHL